MKDTCALVSDDCSCSFYFLTIWLFSNSLIINSILLTFFLLIDQFANPLDLIILAIAVSFFCQLGDLFISFLKRKAKVKDTGDILPGHGGLLDRIDGMILALPVGIYIWEFLITIVWKKKLLF